MGGARGGASLASDACDDSCCCCCAVCFCCSAAFFSDVMISRILPLGTGALSYGEEIEDRSNSEISTFMKCMEMLIHNN